MQNRTLGVLVFPTNRSDIILGNPFLLHYGSYNKNNSNVNRKTYYSEEQNRDCSNSSNPIGDNLSFCHHFSNEISTNLTGKMSESMESTHQCSKSGIYQQRTRNDEKEQQNMIKEQQKPLIIQIENRSGKSNGSKMTNTENESVGRKLSNLSKESKFSKFPEINITSTSHNSSSEIHKNPSASNIQQSNFTYNSKSLSSNSTMQAKQKFIEPIIQRRSLADVEQYENNIYQRHSSDGLVKEILDDLDNALDIDEYMSFNEIQQNSQKSIAISDDLLDDSKYSPIYEYDDNTRSAYKSKDDKGEYEIKSNKIKTTILISDHLNDQLIQELKQLPQGIMSLKDYKQKQKNLIIEREKLLEIDIEEMRKACTLDKYISQVPEFISGTTKLLPTWKRQILARKIAIKDMQRKEEELRRKFQEWKIRLYPIRRELKS
ncbi:unnamed protein product [Cercopithifilaria johnstoni]|uniref:Uncharacterized protein n=1 Tax=Cercopithifilaria johnstoni TaxID=2874296 RepID=A0A8J2MLI3_9BILA|nr:unnamed protein product [Cercopithifilaria johnstoni]